MQMLIIGRTGAGKDTLANELKKHGLNVLCSITTRPRRPHEGETHLFVSEEEANKMTDRVAETVIAGYQYFCTRDQYKNSDIYIIDVNGMWDLFTRANDKVTVVYITTPENLRLQRATARGDNMGDSQTFVKRQASEDAQFSSFEHSISSHEELQKFKARAPQVNAVIHVNNSGDQEKLVAAAEEIVSWLNKESDQLIEIP